MGIIVKNINFSVRLSLTALRIVGFWEPQNMGSEKKILYNIYGFLSFMFLLGTYLIIQSVDLYQIWGDLSVMTATAFLLFTNFAHSTKLLFMFARRKNIQAIITDGDAVLRAEQSHEGQQIVKSCDRESLYQQLVFFILTIITIFGWASSAEKNELPLPAWYPYDTSRSPAYEITYVHQMFAILIDAFLNVSKDTLATALIAQCRCRLSLVALSLRNLCNESHPIGGETSNISLTPSPNTLLLTQDQEVIVKRRLRVCVIQHQRALETAQLLQHCFSEPTFMQLTVSLIIICVTLFELTEQTSNPIRLLAMIAYLLHMIFQVFIFCYQGNQLSVESEEVASAAYECPWYSCRAPLRRSVAILMTRCRYITKFTAGGFTTLSLASFMAIIKSSYSMFTLLQQVDSE